MISALNRFPNGTIELTITIPWKRVGESYQKNLARLAQNVTIKGFRKGKAPLKRVEQKLGKPALYQEVLKNLVTDVYLEAVKEQKIKPIINPQIKVLSLEENKDWQIMAVTCELPEVKLKDYQAAIKKELASEKIWVPGKDKEKPTAEKETKRLDKIFKTLLATAEVEIPAILTEEEVNRKLASLVDQTQKLGLTVEQYLVSSGKTKDQLRQEYQKQTEETLKLELILSAIADEENIKIEEVDVEKMIRAMPGDEKTKESFDNPTQRAYLRQLLRKRAVIDKLTKL